MATRRLTAIRLRKRIDMEILKTLSREGERRGLSFILIGGHALNAHGVSRQTGDVDLAVSQGEKEAWRALLEDLGYKLYHEHSAFLQFTAPSLDAWPIDLMLVDGLTLAGLCDDGKKVDFDGTSVRVPCVEHLLAMKLHAIRQAQADRELKDLEDITRLIESARMDVHGAELRDLCDQYGTRDLYERIVEILEKRRGLEP